MGLRIKKKIPEELANWQKEHSVYGYHWVHTTVKSADGKTEVVTNSERKYALSEYEGMIKIPDNIRKYFKASANADNKVLEVKEPKPKAKKEPNPKK